MGIEQDMENDNPDKDFKSLINSRMKTFVQKLDDSLREQIVEPVTDLIKKMKELENKIVAIDEKVASVNRQASTGIDAGNNVAFSFKNIDESVNLIPSHVASTMKFVMLVESMVKGKKEYTAKEIAERIVNDYGEIEGKMLVESLKECVKDGREKKMKTTIDEIIKLLAREGMA